MTRLPRLDLLKATRLTGGRFAKVTELLREVLPGGTLPLGRMPERAVPAKAEPAPGPGRFLVAQFSNEFGSRPYKLYVPSKYDGRPLPLLVMLHGCSQSPDDFAAGTRMNAAAEAGGWLVAYPEQTQAANASRCWNWFQAADQLRDRGEPSLIAGITRDVMDRHAVDPRHVHIAGLSAGAAAAANMGGLYPELYAAIGVHSGLACGVASDLSSAFVAMRDGAMARAPIRDGAGRRVMPAIVFHGDRDTTVHPRNGDAVIAHADPDDGYQRRQEFGQVPDGHAYTRTLYAGAGGDTVLEHWAVHGAGHAWSGGSPAGSFTDPLGPDATGEMLRFFRNHPHPSPGEPVGAADRERGR